MSGFKTYSLIYSVLCGELVLFLFSVLVTITVVKFMLKT